MMARLLRFGSRRFRPGPVAVALGAATLIAAALYGLVIAWLLHMVEPAQPHSIRPVAPFAHRATCPTAALSPGVRRNLGVVAWVQDGTLRTLTPSTCAVRTLVTSEAAAPVRFSPDGRWAAFGTGQLVPVSGGPVEDPFGAAIRSWKWSPTSDVLAGVTAGGGLVVVSPGGAPRTVIRDGSSVRDVAFAPDGRHLAVDRAGVGLQLVDAETARVRTLLPQPGRAAVPRIAGWSGDGRWVLYWRGPVDPAGGPLDAVSVTGGGWVNVWGHVLPYRDFVSPCGAGVVITAGSGDALSQGKQIFTSGPPDWRFHDLSHDPSRSWFWAACSPSGRWIAVTDALSQPETPGQTAPRALWLLASHGSTRRLLVPGFDAAPEYPGWSNDSRVILVVLRAGPRWESPGSLAMFQIDPRSGRLVRRTGPLVDIGSAPGPGGHQGWASMMDWAPGTSR